MDKKKTESLTGCTMRVGALLLLFAVVVGGAGVYCLMVVGEGVLRWWAGIATLVAIVGIPAAFILGLYGSRERMAGMTIGVNQIVGAAGKVIDLRGQAAAAVRTATTAPGQPMPPTDFSQIVVTRAPRPALRDGKDIYV